MNKIILLSLATILTGCNLNLQEVRLRESACKAEGGEVLRSTLSNGMVEDIYCKVDGVKYWVNSEGKLI